jgi:hypothetical protein
MSLSSTLVFISFLNLLWPFGIKWTLIDTVWGGEANIDTNKTVFLILTGIYVYIMGVFASSSSSIEKCDEVTSMNFVIPLIMIFLVLIILLEKSSFVDWLAGIFGGYNNPEYTFPKLFILGFLLMVFSWPLISIIWFESQKITCTPKQEDLDKFEELITNEK